MSNPQGPHKALLVAGLGYGDEGKGSIVDYLVRREKAVAVVRYNGGAQAAHRVALHDGREHVFSQFGSGTFVPGVETFLSRFMLVNPFGLLPECENLEKLGVKDALRRLVIDEDAPVTTPFHVAANRVLEAGRGVRRHGSCGLGIGETMADVREFGYEALRMHDLLDSDVLRKKLNWIRDRKREKVKLFMGDASIDEVSRWALEDPQFLEQCLGRMLKFAQRIHVVDRRYLKRLLQKGPLVFEGAQGVLLDPKIGFPPHVTKTDITYANAIALLGEAGYQGPIQRVGVIRSYFTRHGAGPFLTEDKELTERLPDPANKTHEWQGNFRVGYFDASAVRYSIRALGGVDELAVTNLDRLKVMPEWKIFLDSQTDYEVFGPVKTMASMFDYVDAIAQRIGYKGKTICSLGSTEIDKVNY